jgi:hypothetical protein
VEEREEMEGGEEEGFGRSPGGREWGEMEGVRIAVHGTQGTPQGTTGGHIMGKQGDKRTCHHHKGHHQGAHHG